MAAPDLPKRVLLVYRGPASDATEADAPLPSDAPLDCELTTIHLPHPRGGHLAPYLLRGDQLLELWRGGPADFASWFVGQGVVEDGCFYAATPVDPTFLLLPCLAAARRGVFVAEEDVFSGDWAPLRPLAARHLPTLADSAIACGGTHWRLAESRVRDWLLAKAAAVGAGLRAGNSGLAWTSTSLRAQVLEIMGEALPAAYAASLASAMGAPLPGLEPGTRVPGTGVPDESVAPGTRVPAEAPPQKRGAESMVAKPESKKAAIAAKQLAGRVASKAKERAKDARGSDAAGFAAFFVKKQAAGKP